MLNIEDPHYFEQEVRRIAWHRWPSAENPGSEIIGGQERDGVFITDECVHLVECTVSRTKDKAEKDLGKLHELYKHYRNIYFERGIKCWFITRHEPTADQRSCAKAIKGAPSGLFCILSFAQFSAKLVDSHEYLQLRERHKFGSIYDPKTGSTTSSITYIESGLKIRGENEHKSVEYIANSCLSGDRFTLLGEYGVGKSMTLREVFRFLVKKYRKDAANYFPIYLNLSEHQGQTDPSEILERHARIIGFPNPSQLVKAWKANYIVLLLDGFDEVSSLGLQGAWRKLRDARKSSMTGVRKLISDSPQTMGIIIAGREYFFDTEEERKKSLGQELGWKDVRLDEFGEQQIAQLVKQFGFSGKIPSWVPSRPLLLSTLFSKGLSVDSTNKLSTIHDPAEGWDLLINEVCTREARIEKGISGEQVRAILEDLATLARNKDSGLGPLSTDDLLDAFRTVCGFNPTDESLNVLQRLPGLGRDSSTEEESRTFIDFEFADACRAGDFVRFCLNPFDGKSQVSLRDTRHAIGSIGISVAGFILDKNAFEDGHLTAIVKTTDRLGSKAIGATNADLVQLSLKNNLLIREPIIVSNLTIDRFEVENDRSDLEKVTFSECYFLSLEIASSITSNGCPLFQDCLIQELDGRVSEADLPASKFINTYIEKYLSSAGTATATLDLDIPCGSKVLVVLLKKLFVQSLSGRKENALFRGMDNQHQAIVPLILDILQADSLITKLEKGGDPIWMPVRRFRPRVLSIMGSPSTSMDPVIVQARKIK